MSQVLYNYASMAAANAGLQTVVANGTANLATGEGIKNSLGASWNGLSGTSFMDGYTKTVQVTQSNINDAQSFSRAISHGTESMAAGEQASAAMF